MFCFKCGTQISDGSKFCPSCGAPQTTQSVNGPETSEKAKPPKTKKRHGCLTIFLVIMILGALSYPILGIMQRSSESVPVVFDALQYEVNDGKNITESELIEKLGEPDSTEDWDYEVPGGVYYPIRTLYYENAEYSFNNDRLQRVTLYDTFSYNSKKDFLPMFNLKKYANTEINDTNFAYRAYNCGVHDLWLQYEDGKITLTKISYGDVFD